MPNINKVVYDGTTLIDLTSTTATADKIKQGYGAFGKDGVWMDGTAVRSDDGYVYQDEDDYVVLDDEAGVGVGVTALSITSNGTYNAGSRRAYNPVTVNVQPALQSKTVTPTESQQTITPDSGKYGLSQVVVNGIDAGYVGSGVPRKSSDDLSGSNWTYSSTTNYDYIKHQTVIPAGYYSQAINQFWNTNITDVTSLPKQSAVTITPTETRQTAAQSRRWLTGNITVAGISSTYVGSGIPTKSSPDLTISDYSVIAPAGYYSGNATINLGAMTPITSTTSSGELWDTIHATNTQVYVNMPKGYNNTSRYARIYADAGKATTPATTITAAPAITVDANGLITATNSKTQNVTPTVSAGYVTTGTAGTITVGGTSTYQLTTKSSADLTRSGATVTVPAGYYAGDASKTVATMTLPTAPTTTSTGVNIVTISRSTVQRYLNIPTGYHTSSEYYIISSVPNMTLPTTTATTSAGALKSTIARSTATRYINIPTGYNSASGTYAIEAVANGTATTPATTITANPTISINSSGLITATASKTQSVTPTISAGYVSTGTAGTITVSGSATSQLTTKGATTYTPTTTNQTIASGTYLTGTQTISGDSNLVAENIKKDVTIFGITGTAETEPSLVEKIITPTEETQIVLPDNVNTYTYDCISEINGYNKWFDISDWEWFDLDNSAWVKISGNYKLYNLNNELVAMIVFSPTEIHIVNSYVTTSDYSFSMNFDSASSWGSTSNSCVFHTGDNNSSTAAPEYPSIYLAANVNYARAVFELQIEVLGDPIIYVEPQNINSTDYTMTVDYSSLLIGDTLSLYGQLGTWNGSSGSAYNFDSTITWTGEYRKIQKGSGYYIEINPALTTNNTTIHVPNSPLYATFGIYKQIPSTYDGISQVTVNPIPSTYILPSGTLSISAEGSFNVASYNNVSVNTGLYSLITGNTINSMYLNSTYSRIGTGAFYGAYISYVEGSKVSYVDRSAFQTASIRSVSFPELKTIYDYGFYNCRYLSDLGSMPLLSSIGAYAFYSCSSMTTINFPSASIVSNYAFANCTKLSSVSLPILSTVGLGAFYACTSLTTIELSNRTLISSSAFGNCNKLLSVSIPNATSLYGFVFMGCSSLTSVYAPKITFLSDSRFRSCIGLINTNNLTFSNTLSAIGSSAFANCSGLKSVSFSTVTGVSTGAFYQCYNLESISFPALTFVGMGAFSYCSSLKTAFLPTVVSLYSYAFGNCWSLTSIVLRDIQNFTSNNVFNSCYNLLSLYLLSTSVVPLSSTVVFASTPISNYTTSTGGVYGSIFVPESLYSSYRTALRWSSFATRFVSLTDTQISAILGS